MSDTASPGDFLNDAWNSFRVMPQHQVESSSNRISRSSYRRSISVAPRNVGLPPGMSSEECSEKSRWAALSARAVRVARNIPRRSLSAGHKWLSAGDTSLLAVWRSSGMRYTQGALRDRPLERIVIGTSSSPVLVGAEMSLGLKK